MRQILNDAFCFEQFQARLFGPMNSLNKAYSQFLEHTEQTIDSKTQLIAKTSFALKKEIDKITQNLKEIRLQILAL